jgi:Flp pilus assembly protein TadG
MRGLGSIRRLARDEAGTILVFWGIVLGVVLGFVALSFDLGRASITRSELQSFADSVALAAAGELDGNSDAIERATEAANLIVDSQSFGNTDRVLEGEASFTLTFYSRLPADDATALSAQTTDPAAAAFVRVSVTPTVVESTFGAAFAALTSRENQDFDLGATAVAGLSIYACDVQPMMFCLPNNGNYPAKDNIGKMIKLRAGGPNAAWAPGDFGFLDPREVFVNETGPCAGLKGAPLLRCLLGAVDNITKCFNQRGVDIEPGQKAGLENSIFNIRFDIYTQSMNNASYRNNPSYAPAPNVIKGIVPTSNGNGNGGGGGGNNGGGNNGGGNNGGGNNGNGGGNQCIGNNPTVSPNTVALPRDTCFTTGTCSRFGDGDWSAGRTTYETVNYGGPVASRNGIRTRYEYYLDEIRVSGAGRILPANRAESGRPVCSNQPPAAPDRRIITVAGIDCGANNIRGAASNVPVKEFFKIFLTEPVDEDMNIWGEIVGSASEIGTGAGGTGGLVRDVVQLYR